MKNLKSLKTYILLKEEFGPLVAREFLNDFSNFIVNKVKTLKDKIHFRVEKMDMFGVMEEIKNFIKKNKLNNLKISEPKPIDKKESIFEFDISFT